jgi:hypothetical protein
LEKLKVLKGLVSTVMLGSLLTFSTNAAFAKGEDSKTKKEKRGHLEIIATHYDPPIEYEFQEASAEITPFYIPYTGDEYHYSTKSPYKSKDWGTVITNNSSTTDSVTRSVSRTKFANGSVGGTYETTANFGLIQGKLGLTAEVSFGKSTTTSVTYTFNLPAYTTTTIATGSMAVSTTGSIVHYSNGREVSRKAVNAKYSYDDYADKVSKPL